MFRMCVCKHSRFVENHPIWILKDGTLISRGLCHKAVKVTFHFLVNIVLNAFPYP
jgi:hypothetical protein